MKLLSKLPQSTFEQAMFLNMGQLLSLPLIALGIYFFVKSFEQKRGKLFADIN